MAVLELAIFEVEHALDDPVTKHRLDALEHLLRKTAYALTISDRFNLRAALAALTRAMVSFLVYVAVRADC